MTDQRTRAYLKFLRKNQRLFRALPGDNISEKDKGEMALCLTEFYFNSRHLIEVIKKISERSLDSTKDDLDSFLGDLCRLRTEVYDVTTYWAKILRKPLNTSIDKIADLEYEDPDAAVAEKTIESAMERFDITMNKAKAYPNPNDPRRKGRS